jgi:MFS family permease
MPRNLRLYPYYQLCRSLLFWLPVFFLYFASHVSAAEVLQLEAIYYAGVVALEVPSGYFSDRVGRRITLLISTVSATAAYAVFATSGSFASFAVAQLLLALAMAFNSGTDTSLLYDSLTELGRGAEIGDHEARAQAYSFGGFAVSALVGGALAGVDLQIAYALSGAGAAASFALAAAFTEPTAHDEPALPPLRQLGAVTGALRDPMLRWLMLFAVGITVLAHVPYEFFQPYLAFLFASYDLGDYQVTPLIAGGLVAAMMTASAIVGRRAMAVRSRFGVHGTLIAMLALLGGVIVAMGAVLHPIILPVLMLRSVPYAIATPIVNAEIHPRVATSYRATYFSVQSLAGRLAFSGALAVASLAVGDMAALTHGRMADVMYAFGAGAAILIAALALLRPARSEA